MLVKEEREGGGTVTEGLGWFLGEAADEACCGGKGPTVLR